MVSDISSLAVELARASARVPVPLLVLRLPQFSRVAWREGRSAALRMERLAAAAFEEIARRMLRAGDSIVHERGTDVFAIALTSPSRDFREPSRADCLAVLDRAAIALGEACGLHVETGWTLLRTADDAGELHRHVEAALERGARERERFAFFAAVGHELRTPLTSIRGYIESLIDGALDRETSRRFLQTAWRETLRMGRLLDGMFEFSLLDLSGEGIAGSGCDAAAQLAAACETVAPLARSRRVRIETSAANAGAVALSADAFLQLLINLVENAVKYGREGGCVRVRCRRRDGETIVTVDDDGPGIARTERDAIFGMGVRGSRTPDRPGTGIGLAIVKTIAERAGGSVRAGSSPLGGARFTVSLPEKAESARGAS